MCAFCSAIRQGRSLQMAPTLYASKYCRSSRVLWLAKELDIELEVKGLQVSEFKEPEYLKINPMGQVGALACTNCAITINQCPASAPCRRLPGIPVLSE